ncbi:hypothetical protein B5P45_22425 [Phyllobacterium zundukense]|uniref:Uncharacterized protein n=1 Tax=Phyllobacterium zundukense TaxID=1867719 RepID=A0A2N9VQS0_9HYPH|nr:hypothetical protein BLM14_11985 [Phyllobacterium zundukense]PIO41838.1 hypothetical protein B5P45_22425 [Phyllobacterium zundukense]
MPSQQNQTVFVSFQMSPMMDSYIGKAIIGSSVTASSYRIAQIKAKLARPVQMIAACILSGGLPT